jgi:hypothetical protein
MALKFRQSQHLLLLEYYSQSCHFYTFLFLILYRAEVTIMDNEKKMHGRIQYIKVRKLYIYIYAEFLC